MALDRQELTKPQIIEEAKQLSQRLSALTEKIKTFKKIAKRLTVRPEHFLLMKEVPLHKMTLALIQLIPQLEDLYKELLDIVNEKQKLIQHPALNSIDVKLFQENDVKKEINELVPIGEIEKNAKNLAKFYKPYFWEGPFGNILNPISLCREKWTRNGMSYHSDDEQAAKNYFLTVHYFINLSDIQINDELMRSKLSKLEAYRAKAKECLLSEVNKMEGFHEDYFKIYVDLYKFLFKTSQSQESQISIHRAGQI